MVKISLRLSKMSMRIFLLTQLSNKRLRCFFFSVGVAFRNSESFCICFFSARVRLIFQYTLALAVREARFELEFSDYQEFSDDCRKIDKSMASELRVYNFQSQTLNSWDLLVLQKLIFAGCPSDFWKWRCIDNSAIFVGKRDSCQRDFEWVEL